MNEQFINDLSKELAKLGTIHSVGEEWISYTGKIPSGGIPYCGQEITRETYSALWSWVQAQGLVKTESEWQSIASSQNGNVPFYSSGNGTTTFRMPKLVGYVKGASGQSETGSYVKEGLPNIEGNLTAEDAKGTNFLSDSTKSEISESGAFHISRWVSKYVMDNGSSSFDAPTALDFDASRSNPIYGNSSHVTPETTVVMFGVYAFGTVSNPNSLNVSNLAADIDSIKTGYLPLSGGTMTGGITLRKGDNSIVAPTDDSYIEIEGGTAYKKGGLLGLYGINHPNSAGSFGLGAFSADGTYFTFKGKPDGTLTWGGKHVVRSVNGTTADASGNVTLPVNDGTVTQKYYNAKFTVSYSGTLTVSSLTAYKPVYILVKGLTSSGGTCYWPEVINGAMLNSDEKDSTLTKGALYSFCVIPTGTTITMRFRSNSTSADKYADYAVCVHQ